MTDKPSDAKTAPGGIHVVGPKTLTKVLLAAAVTLCSLAIIIVAASSKTSFAIYLAILGLAAAFGASFFYGLQSVMSKVGESLDGEPVIAYGVGGGGAGFLGAQALVVTPWGITTVAANPWGPGSPVGVMAFADIEKLDYDQYSLSVSGEGKEVALKRCSPFQVRALAEAIGGRIKSTVNDPR